MGTSRLRTPSGRPSQSRDPEGIPIAVMATPKKFGRPKKVSRGRLKIFRQGLARLTPGFARGALALRALQGRLQPRPLLVPAGVLGLQPLIDGLAFGRDRGRSLRLIDGLSLALALLLRGSLRLGAVPLASLLIAFVGGRGLPLRCGNRRAGQRSSWAFEPVLCGLFRTLAAATEFGEPGCSLNGPFDPTGLFRTTARLGHRRGDDVWVVRFPCDTMMEEIAGGAPGLQPPSSAAPRSRDS